MKCPICDTEMEHWSDYMDHILLESEYKCLEEHYLEHFITGATEIGVKVGAKWLHWAWYYDSPSDECEQIRMEIGEIVGKQKEVWLVSGG